MSCIRCVKAVSDEVTHALYKKFCLCECSTYCYECFLEIYIIYNAPPSHIIFRCKKCDKLLEETKWIF